MFFVQIGSFFGPKIHVWLYINQFSCFGRNTKIWIINLDHIRHLSLCVENQFFQIEFVAYVKVSLGISNSKKNGTLKLYDIIPGFSKSFSVMSQFCTLVHIMCQPFFGEY